jgi:hypothetical protein
LGYKKDIWQAEVNSVLEPQRVKPSTKREQKGEMKRKHLIIGLSGALVYLGRKH